MFLCGFAPYHGVVLGDKVVGQRGFDLPQEAAVGEAAGERPQRAVPGFGFGFGFA